MQVSIWGGTKAVVEWNDHSIMKSCNNAGLGLGNTDDHFMQLQPYNYWVHRVRDDASLILSLHGSNGFGVHDPSLHTYSCALGQHHHGSGGGDCIAVLE
jgi:hypothetical protein